MTRTSTSFLAPLPLRPARLAGLLALGILAACTAPAGAAPTGPPAPAARLTVLDPGPAAAMRIGIDPETGLPTAPGAADPLAPLWSLGIRPALDRLPVVRMEDGSLMVDLTGIYLTHAIAHLGWDGRPSLTCSEHDWAAPRWLPVGLARPAPASAKE